MLFRSHWIFHRVRVYLFGHRTADADKRHVVHEISFCDMAHAHGIPNLTAPGLWGAESFCFFFEKREYRGTAKEI